jgi:hypothetical protein
MVLFSRQAHHDQGEHGRKVQLLGNEGCGGRTEPGQEDATLVGQPLHILASEAQDIAALVGTEEEESEVNERTDLAQCELELGDDAEVAAPASDRPEEVRVVVLRHRKHAAVGGHDLGADQIVR